jgi:hypothetical protein
MNRSGAQYMRQTDLAVGSIGALPAEDVTVEVKFTPTDIETQKIGRLASGEMRTCRFLKPVPHATLPNDYTAALLWRAPGTSNTMRIERKGAFAGRFPDLAIVRNGIRFLDEANRQMFGNPTPTDGHTVYIDVPIQNIGSAAATQSFGVEVFDGDPAHGGKPLTDSANSITRRDIAFLDPGATKTVRFRWDPLNNAGLRTIYFRVDGDQRITESNEANNETTKTLKVLTKAKLRTGKLFVGVPTTEEARKPNRIIPLTATLHNDGETTMRMVIVEIFIGPEQEPENKIGEVLLDTVPALQERQAVLQWQTTPALRDRVIQTMQTHGKENAFSFLARQKGSSRRVTNLAQDVAAR